MPASGPLIPITAVGALLVGTVGIVASVAYESDDYPDAWDERVVELVEFVEDERDHEFEHPVEVEFLTPEEYAERTRGDTTELAEEEQEAADDFEGLLRALGLVSGDIDVIESGDDLSDTGTLAFYDSEREVVTVRGTEMDPSLAITVVHELTHVLQDQVFGLDDLAAIDEDTTSGELAAFRAVVEGDAIRIEEAYRFSLSSEEQAAIDEAASEGIDAVEEEGVPEALQALFGLPYLLGRSFVEVLGASGDDAIDDAFDDPPTTEEHLLDPLSFLAGDEPIDVDRPEVVDDAEVTDEGDFGAASLYLVLASRIDRRQALDAAFGWGGDSYVSYRTGDQSCMDLAVRGDELGETDQLAAALNAWAGAGPAGAATVTRTGEGDENGLVHLHACDPGADVAVAPGSAIDALILASIRSSFLAQALGAGASDEQAECVADGNITEFSFEELTGPDIPVDFENRITVVGTACL